MGLAGVNPAAWPALLALWLYRPEVSEPLHSALSPLPPLLPQDSSGLSPRYTFPKAFGQVILALGRFIGLCGGITVVWARSQLYRGCHGCLGKVTVV